MITLLSETSIHGADQTILIPIYSIFRQNGICSILSRGRSHGLAPLLASKTEH